MGAVMSTDPDERIPTAQLFGGPPQVGGHLLRPRRGRRLGFDHCDAGDAVRVASRKTERYGSAERVAYQIYRTGNTHLVEQCRQIRDKLIEAVAGRWTFATAVPAQVIHEDIGAGVGQRLGKGEVVASEAVGQDAVNADDGDRRITGAGRHLLYVVAEAIGQYGRHAQTTFTDCIDRST